MTNERSLIVTLNSPQALPQRGFWRDNRHEKENPPLSDHAKESLAHP